MAKDKKKHFGKLKADPSKHAENNSYCGPLYYEDIKFKCIDCGSEEKWSAEQQKVYFEEWKQPIYHQARRCRSCRKNRRETIAENNRLTAIGLQRKSDRAKSK